MIKSPRGLVVSLRVALVLVLCQETWALAGTTGTINGKVIDDQNKP